jgi:hypothetical protein
MIQRGPSEKWHGLFNEIVAVYLGFIETFEERGTLGPVS